MALWTIAAVALLLNSAYLASTATASLFYFTNVVLHIALGAVLAVFAARRVVTRRVALDRGLLAATTVLAISAATGLAVTVLGATRPFRWLLLTHIASSAAGVAVLAGWVLIRGVRHLTPRVRFGVAFGVLALTLIGVIAGAVAAGRDERRAAQYRIANPEMVPTRMEEEGAGATSPFFPSSANTNVNGLIPANFFLTSESCGRCHRDIYDQWNSSAHHFSSFNNQWYRKSIEYMQDVVGTTPSKWCAGCHDHAVFFNGRFDRPIREQIATPEAQAGLACTSCHAITHVNGTMGQGGFTIEYPPLHDMATSDNALLRFAHDQLLYLDPQPHKETFLKPFHRDQTADFCSSCHKVHLDVPVNGYRWFRGFNDYDNWQASGVSGEGARSFYYPEKPQKCADCHMPRVKSNDPAAKDGLVRSHRFAAANTALPFVNGDAVQLKAVQDFLRDGQISVDIFGIVRTPTTDASSVSQPLGSAEPRIASTFALGEESADYGATQAFIRTPTRSSRRSDEWTRRCGAVNPFEWRWWFALAKSGIFFRAVLWMPSMSGWSSRRWTIAAEQFSIAAVSRTAAPAPWIAAPISTGVSSSMSTEIRSTSATHGPRVQWRTSD